MPSQHSSQAETPVYWLQQTQADVPLARDWLSAGEAVCLDGMRFAKRRADWRLGRWTAKYAFAVHFNLPNEHEALAEIEIRSLPSGAPEVLYRNQPGGVEISLSHRGTKALCAIAPLGTQVGCDLEMVEPHSDAFVTDFFALEEQALIAATSPNQRLWLVPVLWSAKESALKALRAGLRRDTRSVVVNLLDGFPGGQSSSSKLQPTTRADFPVHLSTATSHWRPLQVEDAEGRIFQGWWEDAGDTVRTLVTAPPCTSPICLGLQSNRCQFEMDTIR